MLLHLSDLSSEPLHLQMTNQVRSLILSGQLSEGDSLPSIRKLARDHRVSVITVQRSYEDLTREGLILSRRGKGFFVATVDGDRKLDIARQRLRDGIRPTLDQAFKEGLSKESIREVVSDEIDRRQS